MIGGGFTGNFPRRPGKDNKPDTTLGVVQGNPNLHAPKGFSENEPRAASSPVAPPAHNLNFIDIGPKVLSSPSSAPMEPGNSAPAAVKSVGVEAVWKGIVHGVSGYSKANREIVKRLDSMAKIRFASGMLWNDAEADEEARQIWAAHKWDDVSTSAPRITFLPPSYELKSRYRVIYTMMETEVVHPEMIRIMNDNYEECWTPTHWNAQAFRQSGLRLPIYVMPLGVDPAIYAPTLAARMPTATLLTTTDAGRSEIPAGFIFVYVFQPSFRKGLDFLLSAFEEAFYADRDVGLLLGTTAYGLSGTYGLPNRNIKTRVWALMGKQTERELAAMYRACQVYVCTSRGEGWNLPLCESAACGLPVIAPRTSVHPELIPSGYGFFFEQDGYQTYPEAIKVSKWFEGTPFPQYGAGSKRALVELLRLMRNEYSNAQVIGKRFSAYVRSRYTWGASARLIGERIKALCV